MKKLLVLISVLMCISVFGTKAHSQAIDPAYQVAWPSCSTGTPYMPGTNSCTTSSGTPLSASYTAFYLINNSPRRINLPAVTRALK